MRQFSKKSCRKIAMILLRIVSAVIIVNILVDCGQPPNDVKYPRFRRRLVRRCHALCRELAHTTVAVVDDEITGQRNSGLAAGSGDSDVQTPYCASLYHQCKQSRNNRRYKRNDGSQTRLAKRCHSFCHGLRGVLNLFKTNAGKDYIKPKPKPNPLPVGSICKKGSLGGMGGESFDDKSSASGKRITAMKIVCHSNHVQQILVRYDNTWISHPPGEERKVGHTLSYEFDDDEYITSVYGKNTNMITQITIKTNKRTLPECVADLADKDQEIASTHAGRRLMYISGREGAALDRLTFHWIC